MAVTVEAPSTAAGVRSASGILVTPDGLIVTAAHVARASGRGALIQTRDGARHAARVVHVDPGQDLAVLRLRPPLDFDPGPALVIAQPGRGDPVLAVGLVVGLASRQSVAVRQGRVRSVSSTQSFRFGAFGFRAPLVLAMRVEPGFSGAPVFSEGGRWLGMVAGFELVRDDNGARVNTGETYVISAARIMHRLRELGFTPTRDSGRITPRHPATAAPAGDRGR